MYIYVYEMMILIRKERNKEEKHVSISVTQDSIFEDYVSEFTERISKIRSCQAFELSS